MGSEDPEGGEPDQEEDEQQAVRAGPGPGTIAAARHRIQAEGDQIRSRSPTPPRALFRSTTGKGVAFTDEDVTFLVRFMQYRKYACLRLFHAIVLIFPGFPDLKAESIWSHSGKTLLRRW
jgi:hypothetical protein